MRSQLGHENEMALTQFEQKQNANFEDTKKSGNGIPCPWFYLLLWMTYRTPRKGCILSRQFGQLFRCKNMHAGASYLDEAVFLKLSQRPTDRLSG